MAIRETSASSSTSTNSSYSSTSSGVASSHATTSASSESPRPGDITTEGGQIVAPLNPTPDQSKDPAQPDFTQLNTSTAKPWPESITNTPREGEPGAGETDPSLVPSGAVSPTPGYATAPKTGESGV